MSAMSTPRFARATKTHEAEYYAPHLAHAPMEPVAAVAEYKDGRVVCHANTQNPQAVQDTRRPGLGIDKKNVECHVTLLGGGFGRKSKPDYVAEAALLSKAVGKPVKVTWSREDDIRFDYHHTVAAMYLKAAIGEKGRPTAWLQRVAYPSIGTTFNPAATHAEPFEMMMGWNDVPFDIPNHRAENGPAKNHVRIGWLRSVANIYQAFAIHSFLDELAIWPKRDSVEYLLDMLGHAADRHASTRTTSTTASHRISIRSISAGCGTWCELAAEKSGWAKKTAGRRRALGIAAHRSFLTYVAAAVEVEVDRGRPGNHPAHGDRRRCRDDHQPRSRPLAVRGRRRLRGEHRPHERHHREEVA
jgi:isoquinoline 1-oxidoreductase beta subunit